MLFVLFSSVFFWNSVLGGMVVSQAYSMKLPTQMLRVCGISKILACIDNVCIKFNFVGFYFSTKVAVCRFRLDDGVAPKDLLSSELRVPSPHSRFPSLLKWDIWMFPLFATNFLFPTAEQWGHDRRVFTSVELVSFSLAIAFELCAV